jgi:hypothetical protein
MCVCVCVCMCVYVCLCVCVCVCVCVSVCVGVLRCYYERECINKVTVILFAVCLTIDIFPVTHIRHNSRLFYEQRNSKLLFRRKMSRRGIGVSKRENFFKTLVNIYNSTRCNTEQDFIYHKHCCEKPKYCKMDIVFAHSLTFISFHSSFLFPFFM